MMLSAAESSSRSTAGTVVVLVLLIGGTIYAFGYLRAVMHRANFDYDLPLRRLMHRTTVRGSVPV